MWLLRDLPALAGIVLSFWPLMIMVISDGRRAMRGEKMRPGVYQRLMQMLPVAEAMLRFALHRQAYRVLGWNPRVLRIERPEPVTSWSDFAQRFEAYRVSMMDLHAVAAFFTNEHRRRHRIRTRADANAVRAAHASTDALRAAQHELAGAAATSCQSALIALMLSSARSARPSKHERGLTSARGPPRPYCLLPTPHSPRKRQLPGSRPHAPFPTPQTQSRFPRPRRASCVPAPRFLRS